MAKEASKIEELIRQLNHCWIHKQFEEMEPFFHKEVVLHQPENTNKMTGREQLIESYWQFMQEAEVSDFKVRDMDIEVFENTAVAYYTFRIHYSVENTQYDETGSEMLVFNLHKNHWVIVWRMQLPIL